MPQTSSILRYPGGKTQLTNFVAHTLDINDVQDAIYCEPFCGGAGVALKLLLTSKAKAILLNDGDVAIYSVWAAVLNENERFIEKLKSTRVTIDEWQRQKLIYHRLIKNQSYSFDLAFSTFFLNRTNRSGIILGGPIGGINQQSNYKINCRFNIPNLLDKIEKIYKYKNSIFLYNKDGIDFIQTVLPKFFNSHLFIFLDPPYLNQGKNLYKNSLSYTYHKNLASIMQEMKNIYWIMTYDDNDTIRNLYESTKHFRYSLNYSAMTKRKQYELLFSSEITQVDSYEKIKLENY